MRDLLYNMQTEESLMSVVHCVTRDHDDQLEAEG